MVKADKLREEQLQEYNKEDSEKSKKKNSDKSRVRSTNWMRGLYKFMRKHIRRLPLDMRPRVAR